jgi:hypothetical protein
MLISYFLSLRGEDDKNDLGDKGGGFKNVVTSFVQRKYYLKKKKNDTQMRTNNTTAHK